MDHPATFSDPILRHLAATLAVLLPEGSRIVDPFAGVGKVHSLGYDSVGVEIEPEWAAMHSRTLCGDSTRLVELVSGQTFDAVVTSPAYGNRMADNYAGDARGTKRFTYRTALGRALSEGSGAAMQWGQSYRDLHRAVWEQCAAVLKPGGLLLVNVSNHIRAGVEQPVVEWHVRTLIDLGFFVDRIDAITTRRVGFGANRNLRVGSEKLVIARSHEREPIDV
jgi:tRNA G10  N-methylase Trm11